MQDRDILLRLLYRAFLDIRLAARAGNVQVGEALSNLLHTLPLAMLKCGDDRACDSVVLEDLKKRAEMLGLSKWLDTALRDVAVNEE
ncbi:hypothetical protein [Peristeroidobacter soli]|uniref:hypothetical protein n=1 Tax=Peristeroidobacter soli TaxID=2497877 RepID=UPI00101B6A9C|nr:hypothetical protein [Peristeroidobacter soli]